MPRGPKGEKRPADAIGNAVMIGRIATGEIEDLTTDDGKNAAAVARRSKVSRVARIGAMAAQPNVNFGGGVSPICNAVGGQ
jgi:hypothetical protein